LNATARGISLLEEDPELATGLPEEDLPLARRVLVVQGLVVDPGPWPFEEPEPSLGVLLLDGLVTVNVVVGDRVASELAGPGDENPLQPAPQALLPVEVGLVVSEQARVAILDQRFIAAVRRWPVLLLTLHERLRLQQRRLAIHVAIGKLRRVEDRVLALLWHLAERWGRVTPDGVMLPLLLTHETLGRLAGAERVEGRRHQRVEQRGLVDVRHAVERQRQRRMGQQLTGDLGMHPLTGIVQRHGAEPDEEERRQRRHGQDGGQPRRARAAQVCDTSATPSTMKPMPVHRAGVIGSARSRCARIATTM